MFAKMSFQLKVLILGVTLTLIPMVVIYAVVYFQNRDMIDTAKAESVKLAYADLDHIAQGVYNMCVAQQELLENKVHSDLNVANYVLGMMGKVSFSDDEVVWEALNQLDHKVTSVKLPKMLVGKTWLGKNFNMAATSPVVDQVKNMVGGTCTIFQRMDEQGSMLRVCTNVEAKNGSRAISTYIPAIDPDGKPNPVVSVVLGGQTFVGRAYVVNAWYVTAYEPIYDADKKVTGMLYVGVKEESVASLREQIMNTRIAKTGRVFILDSMGKFILSDNAKHDGESAWNKQDVEGTYFIQEICEKATKLRLGETLEQRYLWAEGGKDEARTKILRITYFKPWDWIICVGSYEDEFLEVSDKLAAIGRKGSIVLGFVFSFFLLITVLLWLRATQTIIKPFRNIFRGLRSLSTQELNSTDKKLRMMTESLQQGAGELSSAAGQVSSAAQALALGSNEQAAAAEETASSSSEMTVTTQQNADNALEAKKLAEAARINADNGLQAMMRMSTAISEIQNSSTDTAKIMKVIDEIAFQTNLLALNAAVEAVHAGEAGKSFAVVAEEVRNLAQRSAKAAKDTATLIEQSVKSADNGVQISREVGETFQGITENSRKMNDLVVQIAASSNDQAGGIKQINIAIEQMGAVTQQNASNAEESAAAAEELSSQVEELNHVVRQLRVLLEGTDTRTKQRPDKRFAEEGLTLRGRPELTSHYKNSTSNASPAVESHLQEYDDKFPKKRGEKDGDDDLMLPEDMIPLDDDEEAMLSRY